MGRAPSFSPDSVKRIVAQLTAENLQPTPYRIQRRLGGGSIPWIEKTCTEIGIDLTGAGLPDGLDPDILKILNLLQPLASHMRTEAQSELTAARDKFQAELASLKADKEQLKTLQAGTFRELEIQRARNEELTELLAQRDSELEEETETRRALESKLEAMKSKVEGLNSELRTKSESIAALRDTLANLQDSSRNQIKILRESHGSELSSIQLQTKALGNKVVELQEQVGTLNRQNGDLVSEKSSLQKKVQELKSTISELKHDIDNTKSSNRVASAKLAKELKEQQSLASKTQRELNAVDVELTAIVTAAWSLLDGEDRKTPAHKRLEKLLHRADNKRDH